jgi:His-Xaa-Ser system radical SAM maturase HxsC
VSLTLQVTGKAQHVGSVLGRVISTSRAAQDEERRDHILRIDRITSNSDLEGYAGAVTTDTPAPECLDTWAVHGTPIVHSVPSLDHLHDGDVVALRPGGKIRTLYRIRSPHNLLFTTERCNSFCLMCSQPPRPVDDRARLYELLRLIDLIDPETRELGITGGEPTLLKDDFLLLIERCKQRLPATALHVLSNGRLFYYGSLARKLAAVGHPDLMIGIPLYSDLDIEHDYVVQCAGAFDDTLIGLHNLGRFGVPVEIRVVLHRQTYQRLPGLAEFIYRNLPFAAQVVFMGLEITGFAVPNLEELWIDPFEARRELRDAVLFLARRGMSVFIYNHPLCVVPQDLWPFCRRSISDWKNDYLPECESCRVRTSCGGFFSSSLQRRTSRHIAAVV